MSDVLYFAAILSIGVGGWLIGRAQREHRYRVEAAANLARANDRANARRNARSHANRLAHTHGDDDGDTGTHRHSDANSHDDGGIHQARRRAIYGPNGGFSTGPAAARGARRRTDETALAVAGYDG